MIGPSTGLNKRIVADTEQRFLIFYASSSEGKQQTMFLLLSEGVKKGSIFET